MLCYDFTSSLRIYLLFNDNIELVQANILKLSIGMVEISNKKITLAGFRRKI